MCFISYKTTIPWTKSKGNYPVRANNTSSLNFNNKLTSLHEKSNASDKYTNINNRISDVSNTQAPANIAIPNKEKSGGEYIYPPPSLIFHRQYLLKLFIRLFCVVTLTFFLLYLKSLEDFFSLFQKLKIY